MAERRRLTDRHVSIHTALPSLMKRKLSWAAVGIILVLMVLPALTLHFFERISYQNELGQRDAQNGKIEEQLTRQKADLQHIIDNLDTRLNCLQLQSDAAVQVCEAHNQNTHL